MAISNYVTFPDKQTIINHFNTSSEGHLVSCLLDTFPIKDKIAEAFQNMTMLPEQIKYGVQRVFLLENKTYAYLDDFSQFDPTVPALLNKFARAEKEHYGYIWLAYARVLKDIATSTPLYYKKGICEL